MRASYAFVLQKNNVEVSAYSVLTPTFIIEPKKERLVGAVPYCLYTNP